MASETAQCTGLTAAETLYRSLPLPAGSRCIRVLDVQPPSVAHPNGHHLVGKLRVVNLDASPSPSFAALSYVWGAIEDAAPTSTISCAPTDATLQLTNNCYEALINLRAIYQSLTIWIDAICIDQDNGAEKNYQLPLMGEIYARATATYIWFGLSNVSSSRAMTCLSTVGLLEYFFDSADHQPNSTMRIRPWKAAWAVYWRRWRYISHGLRLAWDPLGLRCELSL